MSKTATNSATSSRYYLDTSAHLERWAGSRSVQAEIKRLLEGGHHATSTHVEREWKRIVDGGCAEVLNVLREAPHDIAEVLARLGAGYGRTAAQATRVLLLVSGGGPLDSTLEIRARQFLRFRSRSQFRRNLTVRDGSECGLARNEAFLDDAGNWRLVDRCKKTDQICRQDEFLEGERRRAEAAAITVRDNSDRDRDSDRKMGRTMLAMLATPRDRKGVNCYGKTGDISIALECAADEIILTTDRSFDLVAPAVGRQVHRLKATAPPPPASAGTL